MKKIPAFCYAAFFFCILISAVFSQQTYTDSRKRLRLYSDGETQTVISRSNSGFISRVIADDSRYVQKEYDSLQRLVKETIFILPQQIKNPFSEEKNSQEKNDLKELNGLEDNAVLDEENDVAQKKAVILPDFPREPAILVSYFYDGQNSFPFRSVETNFEKKIKIEQTYAGSSQPVKRTEYILNNENETDKLTQTDEWTYDVKNRPLKKTTTAASGLVYAVEYVYRDGYARPDTILFENGNKTAEYAYTKSGMLLEEKLFFDGGVSIITRYDEGKRAVQIVMTGGKIIREQRFE